MAVYTVRPCRHSGPVAPLKLGPGAVRDREYADWAETEAIALADVLDVLSPQFDFDGGSQELRHGFSRQVAFLHQECIIWRIVPDRGKEV